VKVDVDFLAFVRTEFFETAVGLERVLYRRVEHCKMGGFIGRYASTMSSALRQFASDTRRAVAAYVAVAACVAVAEFHEQIVLMLINLLTIFIFIPYKN